jgi:DNA-binding CsgD family transcriptional regulator
MASGYDPAEGRDQNVRTREAGGHLNRGKLNPGRLLIRPYALVGNPQELLVTVLCVAFLGAIFTAEIFTPDVVVGAFALLPLLAATWVLSARMAALVAISAFVLFVLAVAIETNNRTTVILVGVAVFIPALIARLYARGIASLLTSRRRTRPSIISWTPPAILDGVDESGLGLRSLTRRELEVARLAAEGYTAAEIGGRLNIGNRTVESHLASAYSKLRIRSRLQLMRMASRLGAAPLN